MDMESVSKTIYVDLDDVLCQAARHFLVVVEREFGKRVAYEQLTDFDVGRSCGLSPAERDELYRIVHRPEELLSMAPVNEAIAVLKRWAAQDFEIAIVTGRPPESVEVSLAWLANHQVAHSSFTVVDKYSRFRTDDTDAISLAELAAWRFCWAVEDSLPMAKYLADHMKLPVALIDCPWNQSEETLVGIDRYRDWEAIHAGTLGLTTTGRR
jgi:5'' nucleotidase, deoxy (Pyrimidine), cytosolic type C protein (NT5C).